MKRQCKWTTVIAITAMSYVCFAQQEEFRLSTSSPRPLTDLIDKLNSRYGWSITYEDAPLTASDDYTAPGPGYTLFAKPVNVQTNLPDPVTFAKQEQTDALSARVQEREAVEAVLREYQRSGNRGSYKMLQSGRYIHVFPDKIRQEGGAYVPFESMLSTTVLIPEGAYRMDQLIWLVCDQVARKRGIPIIHGTAPTATLMAITVRESADNEPAGDVLVSAFEDSKAIRASHGAYDVRYFTWALLYDPQMRAYGMNIGWTSKNLPNRLESSQPNKSQTGDTQNSGSKYLPKQPPSFD